MHPTTLVGRPLGGQCGIRRPEGVLTPNIHPNNTVPVCPGWAHCCAFVGGCNPYYLRQWDKGAPDAIWCYSPAPTCNRTGKSSTKPNAAHSRQRGFSQTGCESYTIYSLVDGTIWD